MITGFWKKLKKPFFGLAPMANVTDAAFRFIIAKYGKPDVMWTEFTSADGLCSVGRDKILINFKYSKKERPIVAQLFTAHPEKMKEAAALVSELGFDGLDINMGCPDRSVELQGAGAALMKTPALAQKIILAAKAGAPALPVSVKTRAGYFKNELAAWLPALLETGLSAVTIHARSRKELSNVPAHYDWITEAVSVRYKMGADTLIIGNGDVADLSDAKKKAKETGADGIMLGRAIFGNPWLFAKRRVNLSAEKRLKVMIEHAKLFDKYFKDVKDFAVMRKHFKSYTLGMDGAKKLRIKLMTAENSKEVAEIVRNFLKGVEGLAL